MRTFATAWRLLIVLATCLMHFGAAQPVVPEIPLANGVNERVLTAAQYVVAMKSWNFDALPVISRSRWCLGSGRNPCDLGNRATVACTPGSKVYVIFNVTDTVEGNLIPVSSFQNNEEYNFQCGGSIDSCIPQMNSFVVGNFSNRAEEMQNAISNCTNDTPSVVVCVSESTMGGAMAGLCGFWASQIFPTAQITVTTFQSNWATQANYAFGVIYGRFVQQTLNVSRSAEEVTNSTQIRSTENWAISGSSCGTSPYCKSTQAINASCLLEADITGNSQFLENYPGAVILYGAGQTAAVMWVSEASAAMFVFSNYSLPIQYNPAAFSEMVPLFDPTTMRLPESYYSVYSEFFEATDFDPNPEDRSEVEPMVVKDYVDSFWAFEDVMSSKRQCQGLLGCFNYISAAAVPQQVICTGHGPAGGVATFCGAWAALRFPAATVVTYNVGGPQPVGNSAFSQFLLRANGAFFNFVNNLDPIPRLVSCSKGDSGMMVPGVTTYYVNNTGIIQANDTNFAFVNCSNLLNPDSDCSSYFSEALAASVVLPVNLPPQQPSVSLSTDATPTLSASYDEAIATAFA